MRYLSVTIIFLVLMFNSPSYASLFESWLPLDQNGVPCQVGLHAPNTMYLKKSLEPTNKEVLTLFEKCLVAYCVMVVEEKEYIINPKAEDKLYEFESFILPSEDEYQRLSVFAKRINNILPYRSTAVIGHIRRPFSYFWPTIDIYAAIEKVRGEYPLCADYLDFLLKNPEINIEELKKQMSAKTALSVNGADLMLLFAIHVFDKNGDRDLPLADSEANLIKKEFELTGPEIIHQVVESFNSANKSEGLELSDAEEPAAELIFISDSE